MKVRNRYQDAVQAGDGAVPCDGASEQSSHVRRLVAAGDAAIDNALSSDARRFLQQNKQEGGQ